MKQFTPCVRPWCVLFATCAFVLSTQTAHAQQFFYRNGDRIVFVGDSITERQAYVNFIEAFLHTRFPTWKISVRNVGLSGDTAGMVNRDGISQGLGRDVYPLRPTAVTVNYGMNDGRRDFWAQSHGSNLGGLVDGLKSRGARVLLFTTTPEEREQAGQPAGSSYNVLLRGLAGQLRTVATEKNVPWVDQLNPSIAAIENGRKAGIFTTLIKGRQFTSDAVHPNDAGAYFMAATMLKGMHAPPLVSRVTVDYKTRTFSAENATISNLLVSSRVAFTRLDNALPWPVPQNVRWIEAIPGFAPEQDLSRYRLRVLNLPLPRYDIVLDGNVIGTYTRTELSNGVELGRVATPITAQAERVLSLIAEKNMLFLKRWRYTQLPAELNGGITPEVQAVLDELDLQIKAKERQISGACIPKPHSWSIRPSASTSSTSAQVF